ncbi:UbiA family prenyltransferase [Planotetraspora kaengkrachanensis]|uniref:Membrane protein n=1 Tax=Planotetraspora kaengkrachanensis TaxID=575193 RepID=A0A8J3PX80_9ACTN|nr:UbiA family prenyltransferase [Planotetraspora kaengkrachanensis]GIG82802.1 membrane protein [Planotetraspora kaengkrachanensis]
MGRGSLTGALSGLAKSCHPGPTVAVTALVTALAVAAGHDTSGSVLVAAAILTGQLSVGWCNDAVDAARDTAAARAEKPIVAGLVGVKTVYVSAISAFALCVPLSFACGLLAGAVHLVAVAGAWAYNLRLKATVLSWAPYVVGFGSLPIFVTTGLPGGPWPAWWAVAAAAALGLGAHLANVLPDIAQDVAVGVRGWPQRLGPSRVRTLIPVPLLGASALLVFAPAGPPGSVAWAALAAASVFGVAGTALAGLSPRVPFAAAIGCAAVDVGLLLGSGVGVGV